MYTLDQTFSAENTHTHTGVRPRDGRIEHAWKMSGFIAQERRGRLDFCASQRVRHAISFKGLGFSLGSNFFAVFCVRSIERIQVRSSIFHATNSTDMISEV